MLAVLQVANSFVGRWSKLEGSGATIERLAAESGGMVGLNTEESGV